MTSFIEYVYGIVSASLELEGAPAGVEDSPVSLLAEGDVAALVTKVDAAQYGAEPLERATADVAWLSPRAVAHDRVLTWASDRANGRVVPLPMFSLFRDAESVAAMLRDRRAGLTRLLTKVAAGREYVLRLYRIDTTLLGAIGTLSPRIAALEAEAAAASAGQRYLIERKLEAERKSESRRVTQEVARRVHAELSAHARSVSTDVLPQGPTANAPGTLVTSTAYLVEHGALDDFRQALTVLVTEFEARGLRFEFTGPWPPYHFAKSEGHDD
jgi:hypothetical protein